MVNKKAIRRSGVNDVDAADPATTSLDSFKQTDSINIDVFADFKGTCDSVTIVACMLESVPNSTGVITYKLSKVAAVTLTPTVNTASINGINGRPYYLKVTAIANASGTSNVVDLYTAEYRQYIGGSRVKNEYHV